MERVTGKFIVAMAVTAFVARSVAADGSWPTSEHGERGNWRISVGASVIGPVRSNLRTNAARMRQLSCFGTSLLRHAAAVGGGRTRAEAFAEGSGAAHGGVRMFDGGAWYDPVDLGTPNDPDYSWNWRLHDPQGLDPSGRKGYIEYNAYDAVCETVAFADGDVGTCWSSDASEWFPGLRVEAAYELYRSNRENDGCVERNARPWGVDIAFAFAYYFQRGLWKTGGEAASAAVSGRREKGFWEWWNNSYDEAQYILDYYRDTQFHDGMWGAGSFEGPGAELAVEPWQYRDVGTGSSSYSAGHSLRYRGDGDYREYSIELIARPWWEPWEWLRVFASLGLEVSRREFEWRMDVWGTDGSSCRESGDAADWRVLGLLGGGLSIQWRNFVLAGEALWRFGGDDLDVNGRMVHGGIEHGDWGFRLSLGYEF